MNKSVLIISDLQIPFHHKDSLDFLMSVKKKFKTELTVCIGDETDNYWASSFVKSTKAPNADLELQLSIDELQIFYKKFPECQVITSNHLDRIQKAANERNIPRQVLKSTHEIFKAPKGWNWSRSLKLNINGQYCFFTHGRSKDLSWAKSLGMNVIQGHHHETFQLIYYRPNNELKCTGSLRWSMFVGCLISDDSMAFDYNKNNKQMPILGCSVITDKGIPILVPMFLDKKGNWTGEL